MKLNDRQRRFAELVVQGRPHGRAYEEAGYKARGAAADSEASKLIRNPKVSEYVDKLRKEAIEAAEFTKNDLVQFYVDTIQTPIGEVTPKSRLAASYKYISGQGEDSDDFEEIKIVDKMRAADGLRKMLGWDEPEKKEVALSATEEAVKALMFGNRE